MTTFRQKVQASTNWVKPDLDAQDASGRRSRRNSGDRAAGPRRGRSAPVTAHRLFPAFAAAWFAALLGLASLAVPSAMLGSLVVAIGLPALVPATAPPLGFTAHLLVAFVMAGLGGAIGFALALRLRPAGAAKRRAAEPAVPAAAPEGDDGYKVRARDAHPDAPPRRPLVLTEALGEPLGEAAAVPEIPLLRRKPGQLAAEPAQEAGPWIPEFTPGGAGAVQPLDLSALDLADPEDTPPFAAPRPEVQPEVEDMIPAAAIPAPVLDEPAPVTLAVPPLIAATPQLPAGYAADFADTPGGTRSPVAGATLESLGLVQMIERLAVAISARKAASEAAAALRDALAADAEVDAEPAEPEPEFAPGPFSRPQVASLAREPAPAADVPAAGSAREAILRRLGAIAASDTDGLSTSEGPFSRPVEAPAPAAAEAVVPFRPVDAAATAATSQAGAAPFESDVALRSALATLQRMTARG